MYMQKELHSFTCNNLKIQLAILWCQEQLGFFSDNMKFRKSTEGKLRGREPANPGKWPLCVDVGDKKCHTVPTFILAAAVRNARFYKPRGSWTYLLNQPDIIGH